MNAQLKPNEQAALDVKLANRRSDVFWIDREKARDGLQDEIQETVSFYLPQMLESYKAGDDCQIGQIIANCIANYAMHIENAQKAKEMREEFLPSWRSRVEP